MTSAEGTVPRRRTTRQRVAVLEALAATEEFRSAQQLHASLRGAGASVGLATVYRTLQAMAEAGDVDVVLRGDGEALYRRCSTGHHHHLVCRDCGTTVEVSAVAVERWADQVAAEHGFQDVIHTLELMGRCRACAGRAPSNPAPSNPGPSDPGPSDPGPTGG